MLELRNGPADVKWCHLVNPSFLVWGTCRQSAAGDQLRVVYDQLSRDPASLSNLDQDLPNYAQHQVPIFSLPQVIFACHVAARHVASSPPKNCLLGGSTSA